MTRSRILLSTVLVLASLGGCQSTPSTAAKGYRTVAADPHRDTDAARRHNAEGVRHLSSGDLTNAEKDLKTALAADMLFGPAHNNLGTVYYRQKKLYLAAWEFQYAAQLMPTKARPRNNLGMVQEVTGKLDEATRSYEEALRLEPDCVDVACNLARMYTRSQRQDERTRDLLSQIVRQDSRPEWVAWARERLAILRGSMPATQPAGRE